MENTLFDSQEITVSVGDNVLLILENVDPILHDFFVEDLSAPCLVTEKVEWKESFVSNPNEIQLNQVFIQFEKR